MGDNANRFERHWDVPEIGVAGQKRLLKSSVLIVGMGGLGCPAALYLAAAGIGRVGLADGDEISLSNLQRQVLYDESDVGKPKTAAAAAKLRRMTSVCKIEEHPGFITEENAEKLVSSYDVILDCTDNFDTRYLLNFFAYAAGKPLVSASLHQHDGQLSVFRPFAEGRPCYQCLYPQKDRINLAPSCKEAGVVGPVAGILGTMQAAAALYELVGLGHGLDGQMVIFSGLGFNMKNIYFAKNSDCRVCGTKKTFKDYADYLKQATCST